MYNNKDWRDALKEAETFAISSKDMTIRKEVK